MNDDGKSIIDSIYEIKQKFDENEILDMSNKHLMMPQETYDILMSPGWKSDFITALANNGLCLDNVAVSPHLQHINDDGEEESLFALMNANNELNKLPSIEIPKETNIGLTYLNRKQRREQKRSR